MPAGRKAKMKTLSYNLNLITNRLGSHWRKICILNVRTALQITAIFNPATSPLTITNH